MPLITNIQLKRIKDSGFKGIKLHPFYQRFYADEKRLYEIYETLQKEDLFLVMPLRLVDEYEEE